MESSPSSPSSPKLASLSTFGLIGRSLEIYGMGLTRFWGYCLPLFAIDLVFGKTGFVLCALTVLAFSNSLLLSSAWMMDQAACLFLGIKDRRSADLITMKTSKGQSTAIAEGMTIFFRITGLATLSFAAELTSPFLQFQYIVTNMEGTNILQAGIRSVSITLKLFWKLILCWLVIYSLFLCTSFALGIFLASLAKDMGVEWFSKELPVGELQVHDFFTTKLNKYLTPEALLMLEIGQHAIVDFFLAPLLSITFTGLYLQYRCQKEGMTEEKLAHELLSSKQEDSRGVHNHNAESMPTGIDQTEVDLSGVLLTSKSHRE